MCNQFRQLYYIYKSNIMKRLLLVLAVILALSFTAKKFKMKKENLVYIPAGTFYLNEDTISVMSMYMSPTEVTNAEYKLFLNDLKKQGRTEDLKMAMVDSTQWAIFNKGPLRTDVSPYFNNSRYQNYPVINITKEGAALYCVWYTRKIRLKYPEINFNDFRLPSKLEWIYAAKGGLNRSPYPWGGMYVRNSKGKYLANFVHIGNRNIRKNKDGKYVIIENTDLDYLSLCGGTGSLAPALSYFPNGYGLYNMAGNVNEIVSDEDAVMGGDWKSGGNEIKVTSEKQYTNANPLTGFRMVSTYSPVR